MITYLVLLYILGAFVKGICIYRITKDTLATAADIREARILVWKIYFPGITWPLFWLLLIIYMLSDGIFYLLKNTAFFLVDLLVPPNLKK